MTLSLGIDVGTSGVRTAVIDQTGRLVSDARAAHLPNDPNKIDARQWWRAVEICISNQIENLKAINLSGQDISRIAVDGTSGSMVLVDEKLEPVSPALMYNSKGFDEEASAIASLAPENHITRGSNSALARAMRLVNLSETAPTHLLHQADFITAKLLGTGGYSDFNNTLKTGFDPETETWPDWIGHVMDPALLPVVKAPGETLGRITKQVATDLGLSQSTHIHAGTTDSIAAFLASAPMKIGNAVTSLGSTLAIKVLNTRRIDDVSIGLYSHRIGNFWLVGGASNTGGAVLAEFFSGAQIADLSGQIDPNEISNLDYYPLKSPGERFPINDPFLEPRLTPRPESDAAFLHGMLEGMSIIEAQCFALIAERGGSMPKRIYTAGGGAQNNIWTKIRERHLGCEIEPAGNTEASVGAARLALPSSP